MTSANTGVDPSVAWLCIARLVASSAEDVVRAIAARLLDAGHVRPSFAEATIARERRSPTGLPFAMAAVAIPHAEPAHVVGPAIAVASLARPVRFRQMGSPATNLDVEIVVVPAFTAREQAAATLARLVDLLQDDAFRGRLVAAPDDAKIASLVHARWSLG